MFTLLRKFKFIGLALILMAVAPELGDLVELQDFVNARSEAAFRSVDNNKKYVLGKGTKAEVEEVKYFSGTGNYGLRVRLVNADGVASQDNATMWVYYNVKKPSMQLYSLNGDTQKRQAMLAQWETDPKVKARAVGNPELATDAIVVAPTPALPEKEIPMPAPYPEWRKQSEQAAMDGVADKIEIMNDVTSGSLPTVPCPGCAVPQKEFKACTSNNSYLENQIDALSITGSKAPEGTELQRLLSIHPVYPQLTSCIRTSMETFGAKSAKCSSTSTAAELTSTRACVSPRLLHITEVGFALAVDCLGGMLNGREGDEKVLSATFRNVISVVNLESHFMVNAFNSSGASGMGQMTGPAIDTINDEWDDVMAYIKASPNPTCQQIAKMNLKPMRTELSKACERMSIENGNPVTNMIYSMVHMKAVRDVVEPTLDRSLEAAGIQLSPAFYEEVVGALTNWGHNTGPYGISAPIRSALRMADVQEALKEGNLDRFMRLLKVEVFQYHISKGKSTARSNEASNYYGNLDFAMKTLESQAGRKCEL